MVFYFISELFIFVILLSLCRLPSGIRRLYILRSYIRIVYLLEEAGDLMVLPLWISSQSSAKRKGQDIATCRGWSRNWSHNGILQIWFRRCILSSHCQLGPACALLRLAFRWKCFCPSPSQSLPFEPLCSSRLSCAFPRCPWSLWTMGNLQGLG